MKTLSSIPTAAGALPLVGHLVPLLRNPLRLLTSLPAHGDLVRIGLGPVPVVVVCDPDLTDHVLSHDRVFDKGGLIYERVREATGNGLGTCPYAAYRRQRRLLQPAFSRERMLEYADVMREQIAAFTESWHDGEILDVNAETKQLTSTIVAAALFSSTVPDAILRQAVDDVTTLVDGFWRRMLMPPPLDRLPTPRQSCLRSRPRSPLPHPRRDHHRPPSRYHRPRRLALGACGRPLHLRPRPDRHRNR
jgi:cytochrome P450